VNAVREAFIREQLLDRRNRLEAAMQEFTEAKQLTNLIREVDAALGRMKDGSFGICETCHDPIEEDRLLMNPLTRYCLDHLTPGQRAALESDITLASRIQQSLLPDKHIVSDHWELYHHYEPAGPVSGDYCDVFRTGKPGEIFFIIGDVSGKGIAASILMSHLHALFRSLTALDLPLGEIVGQANRIFTESTLSSHFATLVLGKASSSGSLEVCNAGHPAALFLHNGNPIEIAATGIPLGIFSSVNFDTERLTISETDTLFLYTDGLSETRRSDLSEYGSERISSLLRSAGNRATEHLIGAFLDDVRKFRNGAEQTDDLTLMVLRRRKS
jgi:phosphoserine phosphatase RsbU/P